MTIGVMLGLAIMTIGGIFYLWLFCGDDKTAPILRIMKLSYRKRGWFGPLFFLLLIMVPIIVFAFVNGPITVHAGSVLIHIPYWVLSIMSPAWISSMFFGSINIIKNR